MKWFIWLKQYDTEKSQFLAGFKTGGNDVRDENFVWKAVYLAPDGRFFEYVVGGTATPYASMKYGFPNPGYHILPLYPEYLIEWFETNAFSLEYKEREMLLSEIKMSTGQEYKPPFDIKPPKDWLGF